MATKILSIVAVSSIALSAVLYPIVLPRLKLLGIVGRQIEELNNLQCRKIPSLRSCEDTWLHEPTGYLYAACGNSIDDRLTWFPCNDHWDALNRPTNDYVAYLDTRSTEGSYESRTHKVRLEGFHGLAGEGSFTSHGLGFWVDPTPGSDKMKIYLINHRPSLDGLINALILDESTGANSTVEIFETTVGSEVARHVQTVAHPLIRTPNDVDPTPSGDGFYVTNDHHVKRGHKKALDIVMPWTEVVHCDEKTGQCKVAFDGLTFGNGISRSSAPNEQDIFYVSSTASDKVSVLQRQAHDNSLVLQDTVHFPYLTDNLYTTSAGNIYIASFPSFRSLSAHFATPREAGSHALIAKVSKNTGNEAFFGEKYKVEKLFEDDSTDADTPSGITGMAVDEKEGKLYLASLLQEFMWECDLYEEPLRMKF